MDLAGFRARAEGAGFDANNRQVGFQRLDCPSRPPMRSPEGLQKEPDRKAHPQRMLSQLARPAQGPRLSGLDPKAVQNPAKARPDERSQNERDHEGGPRSRPA